MLIKVTAREPLELERGAVVVCVPLCATEGSGQAQEAMGERFAPVAGDFAVAAEGFAPESEGFASVGEDFARGHERASKTLASILEHTGIEVPVLLSGEAESIERVLEHVATEHSARKLYGLALAQDTETRAINASLEVCAPGDLVLVRPGMEVCEEWLARLRDAALSDSIVATATPWSIGPGGVRLNGESSFQLEVDVGEVDVGLTAARAASIVKRRSQRLRPRIAVAGPGCAYLRRAAIDLLGALDDGDLSKALDGLARKAIVAGMVHVVADDVLVDGRSWGGGHEDRPEVGEQRRADSEEDCAEAVERTLVGDERGRLRRAASIAETGLRALTVTIDGRALTDKVGGTQTYLLDLITALANADGLAVRALVPHDLSDRAREACSGFGVELLDYEQALESPPLSDVVHRPQQAFTPADIALLRLVGRRIVIGQQDLIAYHNYSYHRDFDTWRAYRRTTRLALGVADQVVFFSEHARRDALAEDLLCEDRAHVVSIGAEALAPAASVSSVDAFAAGTSAAGTSAAGTSAAGTSAADLLSAEAVPSANVLPEERGQPAPIPLDAPFLLCMGADYEHKNRGFAIALLLELAKLGWDGRLVLAGSHVERGSSREREQTLIEAAGELAGRVVDIGVVDESRKRWLYEHACALLYPTVYEGFGLLPLEAARAGLPCLFAAQASLMETAGAAATLIPWDARASATAVLPLLRPGAARDEHLARLQKMSIPSWGQVADQLAAVYRQAVAAPSPPAAARAWQELDREQHIVRLAEDVEQLKSVAQEYQDAYHALSERVAEGLPLIDRGGLLSPAQQRGLMRVAARRKIGAVLLAPLGLLGNGGFAHAERTEKELPKG